MTHKCKTFHGLGYFITVENTGLCLRARMFFPASDW